MKKNHDFPQRPNCTPTIYVYEDTSPKYKGWLKVGYTTKNVKERIQEQYPQHSPDNLPCNILHTEHAINSDGTTFTDYTIHKILKDRGIKRMKNREWFKCSLNDVKAAIVAAKTGTKNIENRIFGFSMRPEQEEAVTRTVEYYETAKLKDQLRVPKFLWNAKMRFGKTFTTYQLAKTMNFTKVLILTFKPAVQKSWKEDLLTHTDFEGWQFIGKDIYNPQNTIDQQYKNADKNKPMVCFGSFQDFLGVTETGGIKAKNEWVHTINWDLVVFDEYHYGAWREKAKALFEQDEDVFEHDLTKYDKDEAIDESFLPITANHYLFLSGTPFRALNNGEFIEDQIFNWTYADEQTAKSDPNGNLYDNPYAAMPRMVMITYEMPENIVGIAKKGEFNEFDLNEFFSAKGKEQDAEFIHKEHVQKWLNLIRGAHMETTIDDLKLGAKKPPMPYSDTRLLSVLNHTLWFLPNVASCYAMANLLKEKQNVFYHDYKINVCAGNKAGQGVKALEPVLESMENPLKSKTITLSCGKLTTGVTVKPWQAIFMLRNLSSPETYFQAAFRVQSPWQTTDDIGNKVILKQECYIFDFAINRALKQIADYSCQLNIEEQNPEKKVAEFINFLPVLAYDGISTKEVDARAILDYIMSKTTATLLAKRWESALLVNVDNKTLAKLLANEEAMNALMNIEGFRSLNKDIQVIINKSNAVKARKRENKHTTTKISEEEKEYKSKREYIQKKLIKFATRIPVFMYLTDYRESSLKEVITQLEPELFKKVTGLTMKDFELLVSLNVFNESLMNDAVYKFRRYEDSSLSYTGINKHDKENIGLFSTSLNRQEFENM